MSRCTSRTSYCIVIFLFTSINHNRFKLCVVDILLNLLLTFVCPIDIDLHYIDRHNQAQHDWRLQYERFVALWDVSGDHIVTLEPIEPHMNNHALYMTWYCCITCHFITLMDDVGPMRY